MTPAPGANAVRRRSQHDPSIFDYYGEKNEFAHYGAVRLKNDLRGHKVNRMMTPVRVWGLESKAFCLVLLSSGHAQKERDDSGGSGTRHWRAENRLRLECENGTMTQGRGLVW